MEFYGFKLSHEDIIGFVDWIRTERNRRKFEACIHFELLRLTIRDWYNHFNTLFNDHIMNLVKHAGISGDEELQKRKQEMSAFARQHHYVSESKIHLTDLKNCKLNNEQEGMVNQVGEKLTRFIPVIRSAKLEFNKKYLEDAEPSGPTITIDDVEQAKQAMVSLLDEMDELRSQFFSSMKCRTTNIASLVSKYYETKS